LTGAGVLEENDECSLNGVSNASDPPKCENSTGPLKLAPSSIISAASNEPNPEGFLLIRSELYLLSSSELSNDSIDPKCSCLLFSNSEWKLLL